MSSELFEEYPSLPKKPESSEEERSSLSKLLDPDVAPEIKMTILLDTDPLIIKGWEIESGKKLRDYDYPEDTIYVTRRDVDGVKIFKEDVGRVKKEDNSHVLANIKKLYGKEIEKKAELRMEYLTNLGLKYEDRDLLLNLVHH